MTNCLPGRGRGHRSPRLRRARVAAVITVMAAAALLAAACSGSPSSTGSGGSPNTGRSANSSSAVAYSRCVRSHGVPNFPDPDSNAQIPKEAVVRALREVSDSRAKAATNACANLNPNNAQGSPAQQRQQLTDDLKFAQCMRSHGVPNFPDPTSSDGRVEFVISVSRDGFDPHSSQILAKAHECEHVLPAGTGLPQVSVSA
jgi:hypothetical protein